MRRITSHLADAFGLTDRGRIAESLRLGATAMASALHGKPARLMWRPVPWYASDAPAAVAPAAA